MTIFTIQDETNNITAHASTEEAAAMPDAVSFDSEAGLATLAAEWPASRLVDVWNSLPGVTPVKKFTNRNTAIRRIWAAIQNLGEPAPGAAVPDLATGLADMAEVVPTGADAVVVDVAPETADVARTEAPAGEEPTGEKTAKPAQDGIEARAGSKTESVLKLLRQEGGVTAEELMIATGWQAHSVRGFLSGTIRKKMGLALVSGKREDGTRSYSLPV
jgi:Protein of unknown function (DUF3489)